MIRSAFAVLLLGLLVAAAASVWRQLDRPIATVRVEGHLTAAEQMAIRHVVADNLEEGVLSLDMDRLRDRIRALSWPRSVKVRRLWPDGLTILVEKESVVAAWGDGGYLTTAGKVVRLAEGQALVEDQDAAGVESLPALISELSSPRRAMEVYQMLQSRVHRQGLTIVRLDENALGEWLMTFSGGMTVALGNEALAQRLGRFLTAYQRIRERPEQIEYVDARYDNGVAVRWTETGTDYALR